MSDKFLNYTGLSYLVDALKRRNDLLYMPIGTSIPSVFYDAIKYGDTTMSADSSHKTFEFDASGPISLTAGTRKLTIGHSNSGVTANEYAGTSNANNLSFGDTVTIPKFTVNATGHITAAGTTTFKLPADPGHYEATLITGASSSAASTAAATNGNVYLNLIENNTVRSSHNFVGVNISITSDANGVITFTGTAGTLGTNIVGAANSSTSDAAATDGNVWLNHIENGSTVKSAHNIIGVANSSTSVVSDANGKITIGGPMVGTCSTAAGTQTKAVTLSGFVLRTGAIVRIKFTNANTTANPTLNINSTGAKSIYFKGAAITTSDWNLLGPLSDYVTFMYDGTNYVIVDHPQTISVQKPEVQGTDDILTSSTDFCVTMTDGSPTTRNHGIFATNRVRFVFNTGTTESTGTATLIIGNAIASGTADNAEGGITLFGANSKYFRLKARPDMSGNCEARLPRVAEGILVAATNVGSSGSWDATCGSATTPVYVDDKGVLQASTYTIQTSVPSGALFTDEKVKQTADSGTTAYKVLFGTASSPTSGNTYEAKYSTNITATGAGTLTAKYLVASTSLKITTSGTALTGTAVAADKASTSDSLIATPAMVNAAIADAIAGVTQISYEVVNSLPSTGAAGKIYLLADTSSTSQNIYNEYIWLASSSTYEKLGRTDVDLSGYWSEAELIAITTSEIDDLFTAS